MENDKGAKTKTLYLDGKAICEYRATGDPKKDMETAREILKQKGLYQKITLIQDMYRQAVSFANTAKYLYENDLATLPRNPLSIAPFVVNSAFSIELYLKTLGQIFGQTMRGHQLVKLYDSLSDKAQDSILGEVPRCATLWSIDPSIEFRDSLVHLNDAFVKWRYLYEKGEAREVQILVMIFIMNVLHDACKNSDKTL